MNKSLMFNKERLIISQRRTLHHTYELIKWIRMATDYLLKKNLNKQIKITAMEVELGSLNFFH